MGPLTAIIFFIISAILYIVSVCYFKGKGILFNISYIVARKEEREQMDTKPLFRHTAIVFVLLGTVFLLEGLAAVFSNFWLGALAAVGLVAVVVYIAFGSAKNT
ncbi:MAG: DUF3784 domain-containing protein [Firmicutes bacterium]|nr:DUF3784 domain-containing protein [Bacillota bacterium]